MTKVSHLTPPPARPHAPQAAYASMTPSPSSLVVRLRLPASAATPNGRLVDQFTPNSTDPSPNAKHARRSPNDSSESDSESSDAHKHAEERAAPKKRRKPTSTVRKEEKHALLRELAELEAQAGRLRERVGLPSLVEDRSLESAQRQARDMEDVRRGQLLLFCQGQAMLSQYLRSQFSNPLKIPIVLGKDPIQRRATLLALHQPKLEVAIKYLDSRLAGVDVRKPFNDYQSWTSENGDFCFHRSDITQFEGVGSVKNVFDALVFYLSNMEIAISEQLGQLTLREDIDAVDTRISNHRIVSSTDHGVVVEVNSVTNTEFREASNSEHDNALGLVTNDSVDVDELYPYCPESRVHRTIHAALSLSSYQKPSPSGQSELVVVMRRCAYLSMKKPLFQVSEEAMGDLRATIATWGDVMIKAVRDRARTLAVRDINQTSSHLG